MALYDVIKQSESASSMRFIQDTAVISSTEHDLLEKDLSFSFSLFVLSISVMNGL